MIAVIGSINCDYVLKLSRFPQVGETMHLDDLSIVPGGKGANQAVSSAKLGAKTLFISSMGDDPISEFLEDSLKRYENLDYRIVRATEKTGMAFIEVDRNGENKIMVFRGANGTLKYEDISELEDQISKCGILLLQCEIPLEVNRKAMERFGDGMVILDPAPVDSFSTEILDGVTYVTPNRVEFQSITNVDPKDRMDIIEGSKFFFKHGVENLILKDGENGAFLITRKDDTIHHAIPPKVEAIDTTAAGDVFNGAFAAFMDSGYGEIEALKMAVAAATLSVTRLGAQTSIPSISELNESGLIERIKLERL